MEVTNTPDDEDDDYYVLYWSPILLNGEACSLNIVAEYEEDKDSEYEGEYIKLSGFKILSVTKGLDDNGLSDRSDIQLKPGDIIEPLFYVSYIGEDGEYEDGYVWNTLDSIEVSKNTSIEMIDLWEGIYMLAFEMWDFQGNRYVSDRVYFQYEDSEYYYGHWEDFWYEEEN